MTTTNVYSYDKAGQVAGVCQAANGNTCVTSDPTTSYTYNPNGTRATAVTVDMPDTAANRSTTYAYDDDDRTVSETTGGAVTSFGYDANGNLTSETDASGTRNYTYRMDGNLSAVKLADGTALAYTYDEAGNRTSRTRNGTLDASWTWDTAAGNAVRLSETDAAGNVAHQWWRDPQGDLGTSLADTAGANPVWLIGDYQGSVTDLVSGGTVTGSANLDPYGQALSTSGNYLTSPLRFHGQYVDTLTGLYDMRARDYDPGSGAFTGPDPVAAKAGTAFISTYHYALNRPTVLDDPSGECAILCTALIGAGVGAVVGGIDCAVSWSGWGNCAKKVGIGAAVGAAVGAGAGWIAGSSLGGGWAFAATLGLEGLGGVAYGAASNWATGGGYGWGDAGRDFALGAGFAGAGRVIGAAGRALGVPRAIAIGIDWLKRNTPGPKPRNLGDIRCAPDKPTSNAPINPQPKTGKPTTADRCPHSFAPDTPVLLANGLTVPIADIRIGDRILATDPYTGRTRPQTVTGLHRHLDTALTELTIRRSDGTTATLHTTTRHPFWNSTTHTWIHAANLRPGVTLRGANGQPVNVISARAFHSPRWMHDLTVTTQHTYYVIAGSTPVLVHNTGPGGCGNLWGGKQDGWQHVLEEHVNGSPGVVPGNTTFSDHLDLDDIADLIEDAAQQPGVRNHGINPVTGRPRDGTVHRENFGYPVGSNGENSVEVILNPDGSLRTAYPVLGDDQ